MRKGTQYLTNRDREILLFVHRFKVATDDLLAQRFFDLDRRNTNVLRVTRKLVNRNLLKRMVLGGRDTYLVLTRRGCKNIGVLDRTPKPMTEQSLPAALAIAHYCVRNDDVERLTSAKFAETYPELHRPGLNSSNYYLTKREGRFVLGLFLVDRGGTTHRIKRKIRKFVAQREDLPHFMSLISGDRVEITVLTGLEGQQRIVERHLGGETHLGIRVRVAMVPELGEMLTMK